jgi:membrane-associated phospholipid phosphatase
MSRRTALLLAVVGAAAAGFALLLAYAGVGPTPTAVDRNVQSAIIDQRGRVLTALARTLTFCGSSPELYVALLVGIAVTWRRSPGGRPVLAVCCLLWFVAGQLVRTGLNQWIARPRPPEALHLTGAAGFAFPSGHTTSATMAYGIAVLLVATYAKRRRTVVITAVVAVLAAVGVGLSRVYLGVHWPTDVAAGWALGVLWLGVGALLMRPRVAARRPVAPGPEHSSR